MEFASNWTLLYTTQRIAYNYIKIEITANWTQRTSLQFNLNVSVELDANSIPYLASN